MFDDAIAHYQQVAICLGKVSQAFPWSPNGREETIPLDETNREAVTWLEEARKAEKKGLNSLQIILETL